jgi:hypothetical protein
VPVPEPVPVPVLLVRHWAVRVMLAVTGVLKSYLSPEAVFQRTKVRPERVGLAGEETVYPASTTTEDTAEPPLLSKVTVY